MKWGGGREFKDSKREENNNKKKKLEKKNQLHTMPQ